MNIFGIGPGELILILIIMLVVVGPERLPDLARRAGQMLVRARNWIQASPDAQMVLRMRQELEQELAQIRSSLSEVQSVRDEVLGAARQISQTISDDVLEPVKESVLEVRAAADTIARNAAVNGSGDAVPEAPATSEPSLAPPGLLPAAADPAPDGSAQVDGPPSTALATPQLTELQEISARLEALVVELRRTQEALRQRGLLDVDAPADALAMAAGPESRVDTNGSGTSQRDMTEREPEQAR
jgi:sec-independent protein translocase protein TatB